MGRQVRGYVNREAGFKGAEASQQDAVAEAGDRDQGSAPQGQKARLILTLRMIDR